MTLNYRNDYAEIKKVVYDLDNGICHICHEKVAFKKAVLDHVIPAVSLYRDGIESSDEQWNLRLAHRGCNSRRGSAKIAGQLRLHPVNNIIIATNEGIGATTLDRYLPMLKSMAKYRHLFE